jgi:hypothetical protein
MRARTRARARSRRSGLATWCEQTHNTHDGWIFSVRERRFFFPSFAFCAMRLDALAAPLPIQRSPFRLKRTYRTPSACVVCVNAVRNLRFLFLPPLLLFPQTTGVLDGGVLLAHLLRAFGCVFFFGFFFPLQDIRRPPLDNTLRPPPHTHLYLVCHLS